MCNNFTSKNLQTKVTWNAVIFINIHDKMGFEIFLLKSEFHLTLEMIRVDFLLLIN